MIQQVADYAFNILKIINKVTRNQISRLLAIIAKREQALLDKMSVLDNLYNSSIENLKSASSPEEWQRSWQKVLQASHFPDVRSRSSLFYVPDFLESQRFLDFINFSPKPFTGPLPI